MRQIAARQYVLLTEAPSNKLLTEASSSKLQAPSSQAATICRIDTICSGCDVFFCIMSNKDPWYNVILTIRRNMPYFREDDTKRITNSERRGAQRMSWPSKQLLKNAGLPIRTHCGSLDSAWI